MDEGINFGLLTALGSFPAFPADKDKDLPHGQSYNTRLIKSDLAGWVEMRRDDEADVTAERRLNVVQHENV